MNNPVHNEDLPSGKLFGLIQDRNRLFHVSDAVQHRDGRCVLGTQQSDGAQIQGFLGFRQTRPEFLQPRREELRAFPLHVGVRVLRHQQKKHLWILRWGNGV
jgi:hypothetical protein